MWASRIGKPMIDIGESEKMGLASGSLQRSSVYCPLVFIQPSSDETSLSHQTRRDKINYPGIPAEFDWSELRVGVHAADIVSVTVPLIKEIVDSDSENPLAIRTHVRF